MRRMFSEKQLKEMTIQNVNEGIESGSVQVGTKLYKHTISAESGVILIQLISTKAGYNQNLPITELIDGLIQIDSWFDDNGPGTEVFGCIYTHYGTALKVFGFDESQMKYIGGDDDSMTYQDSAIFRLDTDEVSPL